jgi:hypothetical protein
MTFNSSLSRSAAAQILTHLDRAMTQSTSLVLSTATGRVATAVGKDLAGHTLVCP